MSLLRILVLATAVLAAPRKEDTGRDILGSGGQVGSPQQPKPYKDRIYFIEELLPNHKQSKEYNQNNDDSQVESQNAGPYTDRQLSTNYNYSKNVYDENNNQQGQQFSSQGQQSPENSLAPAPAVGSGQPVASHAPPPYFQKHEDNNSTPLYINNPSRTWPVLKPEEIDYANSEPVVKYDGAQVWNVDINSETKLRVVGELSRNQDIASWGGDHNSADFMIKPERLGRVRNALTGAGIRYNIVIDDLQRFIDDENPELSEEEMELQNRKARAYTFWNTYRSKGHLAMPVMRPTNRRMAMLGAYLGYNALDDRLEYWPSANWGHRMTWKQYHRLSDIHGFLDYLAETYPSLCKVFSIGKSHQGKDLKMIRISNGNPSNKAVVIDGGIHAREWISPATVTYIINEIVENYDAESYTFKNLDWYIIPVLNPDGYEFTHTHDRLWRKNRKGYAVCNGIDLNRNFGYKWGGKGTSQNPCSEIYAGTGAFSESESRSLQNFITKLQNDSGKVNLYATYHSYGEYILYPWGYDNAVPQDYEDLDRVAKGAAQAIVKAGGNAYKVGASSIVLYPAAGGSDDWAKAVPKIKYTYTIELSDKGQYGFVLPASYITKVAKESLAGLRVMADAAIQA